MITAEYLSGCLNHQADWQSRNQKDFTEWKLCPQLFQKLLEGGSTRDRSICFSIVQSAPGLFFMEDITKKFCPRCIATNLVPQTPLRFSPIFTDTQGTKEGRVGESPFFYTDSTNLAEPDMVPRVNSFVSEKSLLLPQHPNLLRNSQRQTHTLLQYQRMRLAAWIITGNIWRKKEFQEGLQILSFHQEERVLTQIIVRPGISGLAGVIKRKLIHFDVL